MDNLASARRLHELQAESMTLMLRHGDLTAPPADVRKIEITPAMIDTVAAIIRAALAR